MSIFGSPVERRREGVFQLVLAAVEEVRKRKPDFDPEDDAFVSAVLHVTRVYVGTHQQEKRECLRNALVSIGTGAQRDADKQQLFLNALDTMTVAHVHVLGVLWEGPQMLNKLGLWRPNDPGRLGVGIHNYGDAVAALCPGTKGQLALVQCVMMDLFSRGFSMIRWPEDPFPQGSAVTGLGGEFLTFIRADVVAK